MENGNWNLYAFGVIALLAIVFGLYACAGQGWKNFSSPPVAADPIQVVNDLYAIVKPKLDAAPVEKEIVKKILREIQSNIPLISDGKMTVNDAFEGALIVAPAPYAPFIIAVKLFFNATVGDIGKQMPADAKQNIILVEKIVNSLLGKL